MQTIYAVFENGVFRPVTPVALPEQAEYVFEPRLVANPKASNGTALERDAHSEDGLRNVYAILSERYASGHTDTAARHNEHQP